MTKKRKQASTKKGKSKQAFKNLLSPTKIGNVELKNRIAVAPMQEHMTGQGGEITEQTLAYEPYPGQRVHDGRIQDRPVEERRTAHPEELGECKDAAPSGQALVSG